MSDLQNTSTSSDNEDVVLRRLAVTAMGLTGSDIQRLVKEARQKARRAGRQLGFADLEDAIRQGLPLLSPEVRWRISIHEAGHAIAWTVTGAGRVLRLTTGQVGGGQTEYYPDSFRVEDESLFSDTLCCHLAGRAAESVILGDVFAGSGGGPESDLAKATIQSLKMESEWGMSKQTPLLYLPSTHIAQDLRLDPALAQRVNERLEDAYDRAKKMMNFQRKALLALAQELNAHSVLEVAEIDIILATHLTKPSP